VGLIAPRSAVSPTPRDLAQHAVKERIMPDNPHTTNLRDDRAALETRRARH
jgi:hypothetical protein